MELQNSIALLWRKDQGTLYVWAFCFCIFPNIVNIFYCGFYEKYDLAWEVVVLPSPVRTGGWTLNFMGLFQLDMLCDSMFPLVATCD